MSRVPGSRVWQRADQLARIAPGAARLADRGRRGSGRHAAGGPALGREARRSPALRSCADEPDDRAQHDPAQPPVREGRASSQDFRDPDLAELLEEISPGETPTRPHRKPWEFAMGAAVPARRRPARRRRRDPRRRRRLTSRSSTGSRTAPGASSRPTSTGAAASATARPSPRCSPTRPRHAPYPYPRGPPRGARHGRAPARVPGRELRRRRLVLVDRALRRAGRHRALGRARSAASCVPAATRSSSPRCSSSTTRSTARRSSPPSGCAHARPALPGRHAAPADDRRVLHAARAAQADASSRAGSS